MTLGAAGALVMARRDHAATLRQGVAVHRGAATRRAPKSPCSWYVSPKGSVRSGGRSINRPTTLRYASYRAGPGDVVCLLGGRYTLRRALLISLRGKPNAWIVFRSYQGRALITATGNINSALFVARSPSAYLQFSGLSFDGGTTNAYEAVIAGVGVHHVRVVDNVVTHMSAAGIAAVGADYMTIVGNKIYRFGDGVGWSSGISLNFGPGVFWYDHAPGFHNVIADNIVAGGVDNSAHHSDGNGIIMDQGGDTPPTLIANNLVYQNGGRCIENLDASHVWVVNNTCYMNGLDSRVGAVGEIQNQEASDIHVINNVAVAWTDRYPYKSDPSANVTFSHDYAFGGLPSLVPSEVATSALELRVANPKFLDPISVDPAGENLWQTALSVLNVGSRFRPATKSILNSGGVDPRAEPGVIPDFRAAFDRWLSHDIVGQPRWVGGRFSVGAYN